MSAQTNPQSRTPWSRGSSKPQDGLFGSRSNEGWHRFSMDDGSGRYILEGLKPGLISIIDKPGPVQGGDDVEISNVEYVASYSWINSAKPTILVPGSPRLWRTDVAYPKRVARDTSTTYVDSNGYRLPQYPLLPIFVAADVLGREGHSTLHWGSVDVLTDRNSLRKLLSFAEDPMPKDFRIDLELAGNWTLLLGRWETKTIEHSTMMGYNDSFERMVTASAPGCEQATLAGHHRVATYDFSGLKMVVRYEVDACFAPASEQPSASKSSTRADTSNSEDSLADALSALSLSKAPSPSTPDDDDKSGKKPYGITIVRAGQVVPQASLVKVKTRSERNAAAFKWEQAYPQLLLGQTKTVMIGVHRNGEFYETREVKIDGPDMAETAKAAQPGLKKLRRLLEELQNTMMERGKEARLSLVCRGGVLQVLERKTPKALLPPDIMARFDD